jgi:hydroxyacylglutathione hydrolase
MVQISPGEANALMARGEVDVIDVRVPSEWSCGHIAGSRLVPLGRFQASPKGALSRDGVVFVCAAGIRSQTAARIAEASGFVRVYNLVGGTRAWARAGLPLVRELAAVG